MRKTLSYKEKKVAAGQRPLRLVTGSIAAYGLSSVVLALFRHFGGDQLVNVGFLCVFALMPVILLILFALPSQLSGKDLQCAVLLLTPFPFLS